MKEFLGHVARIFGVWGCAFFFVACLALLALSLYVSLPIYILVFNGQATP